MSVIAKANPHSISNRLPIRNVANIGVESLEAKNEIGICVKPIFNDYPRKTEDLLEFMELNKMLGVSRFTFYNSKATNDTLCALRPYLRDGSVKLLDWNFDNFKSQVDIRTEGIFAALNDCLYRYVE